MLKSTLIENFGSINSVNTHALLIIFITTILLHSFNNFAGSKVFKMFNPWLFLGINLSSWFIFVEVIPENILLFDKNIIVSSGLKLVLLNILMHLVVLPMFFQIITKHSI